jgi:hypothetical protein
MNSFSQILRSKQLQLIPNKRAVDLLVFFIIEWYRALTLQRYFDYELLKDEGADELLKDEGADF